MERYNRQIMLPEMGEAGQTKLRAAKVLIVGVGGLNSPIAPYLAGTGVDTIGLVDNDGVSLSNLQRQVLCTEEEVGNLGVICTSLRLSALNREIEVSTCPEQLSKGNARELIRQYDIVVDGYGNSTIRYLIGDVCIELGESYVYGATCSFEGQAFVLNYGSGVQRKTYRDLCPDGEEMLRMLPPPKGAVGVTPAVTGSVGVTEVLKIIYGLGEILAGKLRTINLWTLQSNMLSLQRLVSE